ncbi:opioid growth factor receptor-like protein 1 [Mercenaria mercenaria]|uniref:opioid growth factor receptor-like protein 1 n=1 Tax=Mercenaria mercenaria TaxID=6596 RepID=UPI00234E8791|nr:opioid growth factor receptor-like protein 1 [Mercenaria mercenaria]
MSNPKIGKGRNQKGRQTVMGDFFSKSNKTKKSLKTKAQEEEAETGTKVEQTKTETLSVDQKKKGKPAGKQTGTAVEKKPVVQKQKAGKAAGEKQGQAFEKKPGQPVEKKTSLKRKITGAGMFSFSWTRGAQKDTEQYRDGYPGKVDHPDQDDNYRFYMNQIPSKPDGDFIDKIHIDWWGDYRLLEVHHGYIQWLFPIRESGLNWHAQELQQHEIKKLQKSRTAMKRILTSYKMMLDFYGMKLENEEDGTIVRAENWRDRFRHLDRSYHNYLRITRILKSLGEFGYEHLKKNFVKFILYEGLEEGTLSNLIDSCVKYWIGVLKEEEEREEMFDYYEKLNEDENLKWKRRNRSPSPPSSYWSNKNTDSLIGKKVISKKGKEGKAVDPDTKTKFENELSDDDDNGALYHAMRLIDDEVPDETDNNKGGKNKTRKDHEMSDSDGENEYNQDESQEMAHWNNEANKASKEDLEGGSECYDSLNENNVKESVATEKAADSTEENHENVDEQNVKNATGLEEHSTTLNEETKQDVEKKDEETNIIDDTEKEDKDKNIGEVHANEQEDKHSIEDISTENSDKETAKDNIDSSEGKQEEMDTNDTQNDINQGRSIGEGKVEENNVKLEEGLSTKSVTEAETNEEKMETQ